MRVFPKAESRTPKAECRFFRLAVLALLASACSSETTPPPPAAKVFARRVSDVKDLPRGTDNVGGIGDWYLANDLVVAIVDDVGNQNSIAPGGGTLVDFAHVGKDDDQFNSMYQLFMITQDLPILYDRISASADAKSAALTVTGHVFEANPQGPLPAVVAAKLDVTTEYRLFEGDPSLHVRTVLVNHSAGAVGGAFGTPISDVILWGQRSQIPFAPFQGRGYEHPALDVRNPINALGAFLYIGGHGEVEPAVSYGFVAPSLPDALMVGVNTEQLSALGMLPVGDPLQPGASITYERRVLIGTTNSVQSVADQAFRILKAEAPSIIPAIGTLKGIVTGLPAGRSAEVIAEEPPSGFTKAKPMNAVTVSGDGAFELTLPAASYQVRVLVAQQPAVVVGPFTVAQDQATTVPPIASPGLSTVSFEIKSDGAAKPARLTFKGVAPTPDPSLGPRFSGSASGNVVYSVDGKGTVTMDPGTYEVYASRGMEYSLAHERITIAAGATKSLTFAVSRVVNTEGWVSGDFHVHSGKSFDSSVELDTRLLTLAAEGVEVVVGTDHDMIVDYGPSVARLGLKGQIASIVGCEQTGFVPTPELPLTIGHYNYWPLWAHPDQPRNGAPADERLQPAEVYDRYRDIADGTPVIQLNHPRADAAGTIGMGYFTNFGLSPLVAVPATDTGGTNAFLRKKSARGTQNLDFDAMEVLNGANWGSIAHNLQNRDDWFALLKGGFLKAGMANSDTHKVVFEAAGFPRSYVRFQADSPAPLGTGDDAGRAQIGNFDKAIRELRVVGTNGPMIHAKVEGAEPGDVVRPAAATAVPVTIRVESAPWMPVEEVRVLVNGEVVCAVAADGFTQTDVAATCPAGLAAEPADPFGTAGVVRYEQTVVLNLSKDSFVVVEAGAKVPISKDMDGDGVRDTWDTDGDGTVDNKDVTLGGEPPNRAPALPDALVPGLLPWSFTNPVFVDVDGGGWSPPGL